MTPETEIEILKLEKAIAELDADWLSIQNEYKTNVSGSIELPDKNTHYAIITLFILFVVLLIGNFLFSTITVFSFLKCFLIVALLAYIVYTYYLKNLEYKEQKETYIHKRKQLEQELKALKYDIENMN